MRLSRYIGNCSYKELTTQNMHAFSKTLKYFAKILHEVARSINNQNKQII